jgi:putative ABC transport system ATP-binding protein
MPDPATVPHLDHQRSADEPRKFARTSVGRLFELLRSERAYLRAVVIYALGVGTLAVATPVAVQALVNTVAFGGVIQPIVILSALLLGCLSLAAAMRAAQAWVVEVLQRRLFARAVHWIALRIPGPESLEGRATYHPERVNRILETFALQKSAATLLLGGVDAVLAVAVGMLVLAFYHPILLAFDVLLVLGLLTLFFGFGREGAVTALAESSAKYKWFEWVEARALHRAASRSGAFADYSEARLVALSENYLAARSAHFRIVFRQTVAALGLQAVASAVLLALGGLLVVRRELTLGQLVAAELVVASVVAAVSKFGKLVETYYDAVASVSKLDAVARLTGEERDGVQAAKIPTGLSVRVRAADAPDAPVRATVPSGAVAVARVHGAEDAAGWVAAILGDASSSLRADLDGVAAQDWSSRSLDAVVARVSREEVFPVSVLENLLGTASPTEEQTAALQRLLDRLGLSPALAALPSGLRTVLRVDGYPLDSSDAVLLTLARAVLGGARLVILDRALDRFEPEVAARIVRALRAEGPAPTLLVLTEAPGIEGRTDVFAKREAA